VVWLSSERDGRDGGESEQKKQAGEARVWGHLRMSTSIYIFRAVLSYADPGNAGKMRVRSR
jgi:hypothetical protein